jgi:hypothetical protein
MRYESDQWMEVYQTSSLTKNQKWDCPCDYLHLLRTPLKFFSGCSFGRLRPMRKLLGSQVWVRTVGFCNLYLIHFLIRSDNTKLSSIWEETLSVSPICFSFLCFMFFVYSYISPSLNVIHLRSHLSSFASTLVTFQSSFAARCCFVFILTSHGIFPFLLFLLRNAGSCHRLVK